MFRFVILSLAFLLAFAASAASPEYIVGRTEPTPAPWYRSEPAVASNGDDFFAVWVDDRSGAGAIIATRLARDGRILDPLGIRIVEARNRVFDPQVAWDGSAYLVVWTQTDQRDLFDRTIYVARVAPNGGVVTAPRMIAENAMTDRGPCVASNGTVSVIAYTGGDLQGLMTVLDHDGNTVRQETLSSESTYKRDFTVVAGTSRFVVAWAENESFSPDSDIVKAVSLTSTGQPIGAPEKIMPGDRPAIATDGTYFNVVSIRSESWSDSFLMSRRFESNLDPAGNEHTLLANEHLDHAGILWLGDRYEVFATRRVAVGKSEVVSFDISSNGSPGQQRSRGEILGETLFMGHVFATNRTDDVLLARASYTGPAFLPQIFGQLYPGNRTDPTVPSLLSWSGNAHKRSDIASSVHGHFVAWTEEGGTFATRIDRDGNSLDGRGIPLGNFAGGFVRVAFDGTNYVVAWRGNPYVSVRWIAPLTGATVAETEITAAAYPELALAVSPDATYVVLTQGTVSVVRIPHSTHTPDSVPLAVTQDDKIADHPAAAWNGTHLLVVWNEMYYNDRGDPPIYFPLKVHAARVTAGLSLVDPSPLLLAEGEFMTNEQGDSWQESVDLPSVATNGTDWLVVTGHRSTEVTARRVLRSGMLEGNEPVKIGEGRSPVVTWDGTRYVVAWKGGEDQWALTQPLVARTLAPSGPLLPGPPLFISDRAASSRPSIASHGAGTAIAYTKISYLPEHAGVERTFFRVMELGSPRGRVVRR